MEYLGVSHTCLVMEWGEGETEGKTWACDKSLNKADMAEKLLGVSS